MAIIGFQYTKMIAQKNKPVKGKVNVNSNIVVNDIKEAKINVGTASKKGLEISFKFTIEYAPKIAEIVLEGVVVYLGENKVIDDTVDLWKNKKSFNPVLAEEVFNYSLSKCNVQALLMGRDMSLPAHINFPRLTVKKD